MQALLRKFVPATDEVGRLQRGKDPVCQAFQKFAEQGHYKGRVKPSRTRQGMYAVTPGGRFLASCNTRRAKTVLEMLGRALESWEGLSTAERLAGTAHFKDQAVLPRAMRYPSDGLVLRVTTRDLPGHRQPKDWRSRAWNLDYAWFKKTELRSMVPSKNAVGTRHQVPTALVSRLIRLHFLDNVRGQVPPFKPKEVERAELFATIRSVDGPRVELQLVGRSRAVRKGVWHVAGFSDTAKNQEQGFETDLLGHATWNRSESRFEAFELVGIGWRWGGSRFNARSDDLEGGPIGILLSLAKDTPAERVAPARIWNYGW